MLYWSDSAHYRYVSNRRGNSRTQRVDFRLTIPKFLAEIPSQILYAVFVLPTIKKYGDLKKILK